MAMAGEGLRTDSSPSSLPDPKKNPLTMMSEMKEEGSRKEIEMEIDRHLDQITQPDLSEARKETAPAPSEDLSPIRKIGILTSGGDGPGENSAIQALVEGVLFTHRAQGWEILGIREGFLGLLEPKDRIFKLSTHSVFGPGSEEAARKIYGVNFQNKSGVGFIGFESLGGNILQSSRTDPVKDDPSALRVKHTLLEHGIDSLIILGGNGSLGATLDLHRQGIRTVFIPQTIDNDVPGSELSLGFPSAVAKGVQLVRELYHTSHSCNRWFLVEVMGQHSGALALSIAREARADGVFIGEVPRPLREVEGLIQRREREGQKHGVILVSEGARFLDDKGELLEPPRLQDAKGRKVVKSGEVIRWLSERLGKDKTRTDELGYHLRGASPSAHEMSLAQYFARRALDLTASGNFGRMVGLQYDSGRLQAHFPLLESIQGQKHLVDPEHYERVRSSLQMEIAPPIELTNQGPASPLQESEEEAGEALLRRVLQLTHEVLLMGRAPAPLSSFRK
jgi:6-phosphofructokinase 1